MFHVTVCYANLFSSGQANNTTWILYQPVDAFLVQTLKIDSFIQ